MKIVHVEDYFDPTAGYQVNELLRINQKIKDEVYIVTSNDMTPFHKNLDKRKDKIFEKNFNVKVIRLEGGLKISSRLFLKGLWKQIDDINPDLVFLHGIGDFKDLILFKKKKRYIIVRDCHMSWVASKNKFAKIYYKFFKIVFSRIINNSNKYKKIYALGCEEYEYLKAIGISDKKIDYLYHGYNDEVMYYDEKERERIRNLYKLRKDDIVISYIGKFNRYKRPDLIIDIINKLDLDELMINKIKLLFIGSKEREFEVIFNKKLDMLEKKIDIIIEDSKPFNELKNYFSASDICIFPKETTLSSIHAQVCGCPVIMEEHDSNKERVIIQENLYKIDDINAATLILKRIIDDKGYEKIENLQRIKSLEVIEYKKQFKKILEIEGNI